LAITHNSGLEDNSEKIEIFRKMFFDSQIYVTTSFDF